MLKEGKLELKVDECSGFREPIIIALNIIANVVLGVLSSRFYTSWTRKGFVSWISSKKT